MRENLSLRYSFGSQHRPSALNMQEAMKVLIEQKARLTKSSTDGKESHTIIKAHGSGITDDQ